MEIATFAAGCFWGVEETFQSITGVISTRVGYCGGHTVDPSYQDVCTQNTDHAESVEVTYDPHILSYTGLLKIFWDCHDPTQINRQGPDHGIQYRSVIFYHNRDQHQLAIASRDELESNHIVKRSIATQIVPVGMFWEAEAYHQKYYLKNSGGCGF